MHGGVRKQIKPGSPDHERSRELKRRGTKNLSTKELQELTQRLQLEKRYKDLTPSNLKKGMDVVKAVAGAGTTVASLCALSKSTLAQEISKVLKKSV